MRLVSVSAFESGLQSVVNLQKSAGPLVERLVLDQAEAREQSIRVFATLWTFERYGLLLHGSTLPFRVEFRRNFETVDRES